MSEFKEYRYVLEYKALLISVGTHILEASHIFYLSELFTELALSPNSNEVHVYGWMGSEARWSLLDRLCEHVERVTGVDWAPVSNRIVTCGSVSSAAKMLSVVEVNNVRPLVRVQEGRLAHKNLFYCYRRSGEGGPKRSWLSQVNLENGH